MLTVAVGLDFLGAEEINSDTGGLEVSAALPPEAVHRLSDTGFIAAESGADELMIGGVKTFKLLWNRNAADVNTMTTRGIGLIDEDPFKECIAGARFS